MFQIHVHAPVPTASRSALQQSLDFKRILQSPCAGAPQQRHSLLAVLALCTVCTHKLKSQASSELIMSQMHAVRDALRTEGKDKVLLHMADPVTDSNHHVVKSAEAGDASDYSPCRRSTTRKYGR